jgi:hypothetical protein
MWMLLVAAPVGLRAQNQPVSPYFPPGFETRDTGHDQDTSGSLKIRPRPAPQTVKVTYVMVSDERDWRNLDGRVIRASLLAFDRKPGESDDALLTLVRDGKVRLLLEGRKKVTEYPLSKLSQPDQAFVKERVEAQARARAATDEAAPDGR